MIFFIHFTTREILFVRHCELIWEDSRGSPLSYCGVFSPLGAEDHDSNDNDQQQVLGQVILTDFCHFVMKKLFAFSTLYIYIGL